MFLYIAIFVLKKRTLDLFWLTSVPVAIAKLFKISLIVLASLTMGIPYSIVSSTNCW